MIVKDDEMRFSAKTIALSVKIKDTILEFNKNEDITGEEAMIALLINVLTIIELSDEPKTSLEERSKKV